MSIDSTNLISRVNIAYKYGLKVRDVLGNTCVLTPDVKSIISAGTVYMPGFLWGTVGSYTYGVNIPLPGTTAYSENDIGVLVKLRDYSVGGIYKAWIAGLKVNEWAFARWLISGADYWTRDDSTGYLTTFSETSYHDTIYNVHPAAFWDKMGNTTFTYIRLFAGMVYEIYHASASDYLKVYNLGAGGRVIDYVIYLRNL